MMEEVKANPGALLGQKREMSQIFRDDGTVVPVTVIEVGPCVVTQIKTYAQEGYNAIQLGFGWARRVSKPLLGHLKKSGARPRFLREVRLTRKERKLLQELKIGQWFKVGDVFSVGNKVQITGQAKGKGFAGVIKRWSFSTQPKTHGQGTWHRAPGSIGAQGVGKVFKGKKMAGRMGGHRVTVKGLEVVAIDNEKNLLLVKGAVPGPRGNLLLIRQQK